MICMRTKPLLIALVAACGVTSGASADPDKQPPPEPPLEKEHYFCCQELDPKGFSGENCTEIPESHVIACSKVLYCDGKYKKDEGKVTCE